MRYSNFARDLAAVAADARRPGVRFSSPEYVALRPKVARAVWSPGERTLWESVRDAIRDRSAFDVGSLSIRALFEATVSNGRELVESWDPINRGGSSYQQLSLLEATGAVDSSVFREISGQIAYTTMLQAFEAEASVFAPAIPTIASRYNGERIPGLTPLNSGSRPIVGEREQYPEIGVGPDWIDTPQTAKEGFITGLSKEAIFFDNTGMLVRAMSEGGKELGYWHEVLAIDSLIDENDTRHRYKWQGTTYATYQTSSPWDNTTASNALVDWTDIDAALLTLAAVRDPHTGRPIVNEPKDLVVTPQLAATAKRIMSATEIRVGDGASATTQTVSANPVKPYRLLSSQLLADRLATDTDWFLGDVARQLKYIENWPLTTVQAPPNSTEEFNRDIAMQWKTSRRGIFATMEPRVTTKCTA